ncbi:MAG TPA: hypothetical protein VNF71_07000 [Acidimicrobiales bacterium]|nr:hypothetical protein [Acidimicrobiales bacterium]
MSAADRITALEAEVAELRAFVPMLARMAFYEALNGVSIPDAVRAVNDCCEQGVIPESRRSADEPLPAAAQVLHDAYDRRERTQRARRAS